MKLAQVDKGEIMKYFSLIICLCISIIGCRGKDGHDGEGGGVMQTFEGITNVEFFAVPVINFTLNDEVSVYYALATEPDTYFELTGPSVPVSSTTPYYAIIGSGGDSVIIRLYGVPIGTHYRILIWRPSHLY